MKTAGLPKRLKQWREENGFSYRGFADRLNEHLPKEKEVSYATLRDWEQEGSRGPRAEVLEALVETFDDLRLEWLLFGEGRRREVEEELSTQEEVEVRTESGVDRYAVPQWPTVRDLPPVSREMFYHVVADLLHSASDLDNLEQERRAELLEKQALAVQNLLMLPLHAWGFMGREELSEREYEAYTVAFLHAMSLITKPSRQGSPGADYEGSPLDDLEQWADERFSVTMRGDESDD